MTRMSVSVNRGALPQVSATQPGGAASSQISRVLSRTTIGAPKLDSLYWRSRPFGERLEALEEIRQEFHRWKFGAEPRLQRVLSISRR